MTNKQKKEFDAWAVGTITGQAMGSNIDYLPEEESVYSRIDTHPRVLILRALGYKIENWEGYAQAEINELGSDSLKKGA